jgi:hypothetical protein
MKAGNRPSLPTAGSIALKIFVMWAAKPGMSILIHGAAVQHLSTISVGLLTHAAMTTEEFADFVTDAGRA